jgi:hypothetical protein
VRLKKGPSSAAHPARADHRLERSAMPRLTLRPVAHPLNAPEGASVPQGVELRPVEWVQTRDQGVQWLAKALKILRARRLGS